jgi:hypothetical protein
LISMISSIEPSRGLTLSQVNNRKIGNSTVKAEGEASTAKTNTAKKTETTATEKTTATTEATTSTAKTTEPKATKTETVVEDTTGVSSGAVTEANVAKIIETSAGLLTTLAPFKLTGNNPQQTNGALSLPDLKLVQSLLTELIANDLNADKLEAKTTASQPKALLEALMASWITTNPADASLKTTNPKALAEKIKAFVTNRLVDPYTPITQKNLEANVLMTQKGRDALSSVLLTPEGIGRYYGALATPKTVASPAQSATTTPTATVPTSPVTPAATTSATPVNPTLAAMGTTPTEVQQLLAKYPSVTGVQPPGQGNNATVANGATANGLTPPATGVGQLYQFTLSDGTKTMIRNPFIKDPNAVAVATPTTATATGLNPALAVLNGNLNNNNPAGYSPYLSPSVAPTATTPKTTT